MCAEQTTKCQRSLGFCGGFEALVTVTEVKSMTCCIPLARSRVRFFSSYLFSLHWNVIVFPVGTLIIAFLFLMLLLLIQPGDLWITEEPILGVPLPNSKCKEREREREMTQEKGINEHC